MTTLLRALLALHVAAGTAALVVAPVAMLTLKGGRAHRWWGAVYYRAMAVVAATALVLAAWHPSPFLGLVAIFSFYFAFRARRVLGHKRPEVGEGPGVLDWTAAGLTALASAALAILGILQPGPVWVRLGPVPVVFGVLGLVLAGLDLRRFRQPPADPRTWWYVHMTGMLGSYLAALSAFSVVNFTFLPTTVRWLWPTVIGTPLIALWVASYRRRFAERKTSTAVAA